MASGHEAPVVVRPERAADPEELARIVHMEAREEQTRLSPFRLREQTSYRVSVSDGSVAFDETVSFEAGQKGRFHGLRENSKGEGVEAWFSGDALIVRMKGAKAIRRR